MNKAKPCGATDRAGMLREGLTAAILCLLVLMAHLVLRLLWCGWQTLKPHSSDHC